ncbi:MAG: hypothetical protein O3C21_09730 [Verrucomicrobia bacterium]|nr:hypothetical protein [Verrucomicrobiota bacterium]
MANKVAGTLLLQAAKFCHCRPGDFALQAGAAETGGGGKAFLESREHYGTGGDGRAPALCRGGIGGAGAGVGPAAGRADGGRGPVFVYRAAHCQVAPR